MDHSVKIAIYVGPGASHSWTWCVDLFERLGLTDLNLVGSTDEFAAIHNRLDLLVVSGGDTAAIAGGLKSWGPTAVQEFVEGGGIYVGVCAGACLMLRSSKIELSDFNLTSCTIANIAQEPPEAINLAHKCFVPYKDRFVFQTVYGPVHVSLHGSHPFVEERSIKVPLYGGPAILASDDVELLARFERFDDEAIFVVDEGLATETLLGRAAAVRKKIGDGCVYLLSPHFEHPSHFEANGTLMGWLAEQRTAFGDVVRQAFERPARFERNSTGRRRTPSHGSSEELRRLRSAVSEARIVASGIVRHPITWLIGKKVWEPEKLDLFLLAVWKRLPLFAEAIGNGLSGSEMAELCQLAEAGLAELRVFRQQVADGGDSLAQAEDTFELLQRFARSFLVLYFQTIACTNRKPTAVGAFRETPYWHQP